MTWILGQMTLVVGLTHVFRVVVCRLGPRRGGLLLGLPTTTGLLLITSGIERGVGEVTAIADACLLGLSASVTLPVVYGKMLTRKARPLSAAIASVATWLGLMLILGCLPSDGGKAVILASFGVVLACHAALRLGRLDSPLPSKEALSPAAIFPRYLTISRAVVPGLSFLGARSLRSLAGPELSGQFMTFPGASLSVLISTHLETGAASACRVAASMPSGGLVMLAFLSTVRTTGQCLGLGGAIALGYASALATVLVVDSANRYQVKSKSRDGRTATAGRSRPGQRSKLRQSSRSASFRFDPKSQTRHSMEKRRRRRRVRARRFAPRVESVVA